MRKPPTFEEWQVIIKNYLVKSLSYLTEGEIEEYLDKEKSYMHNEYNRDVKAYKSGEIGYGVITVGSPASVADCLNMMYE